MYHAKPIKKIGETRMAVVQLKFPASGSSISYDALISAIYRSVDDDDAWPEALDILRDYLGANVACLRIAQQSKSHRQYLFASGPRATEESIREWEQINARELLPRDLKPGETTLIDWHLVSNAVQCSKLLQRYDIAVTATVCVDVIDDAQYTLNCSRGFKDSEFRPADLDAFRQIAEHFRRAMALRRQNMQIKVVSQFQTEALDSLGIAAILINRGGGHVVLNRTAQEALDEGIGLEMTARGLRAVDGTDDGAFQQALRAALCEKEPAGSRAMLINSGDGDRRLHLVVSSRRHNSIISGETETSALIFLRVKEIVGDADKKLLQQLFSFTATEANLAVGLAKGLCLKDVESQLKIRHNTARAHLRSMFAKADVSRQAQLVSLLANSLVPLGRMSSPPLQ